MRTDKKGRYGALWAESSFLCLTPITRRFTHHRVAMDYGYCDHAISATTEKFTYSGPPYDHCKAILKSIQSGGQIVITNAVNKALLEIDDAFQDSHKVSLGTHVLQNLEQPLELIQCLPQDLAERELLPLISVSKISPDYYDAPSADVPAGMPIPPVTIINTRMAEAVLKKVRSGSADRVMFLHDLVLRKYLQENEGYECQSEKGNFMLAFPSPERACTWIISTHLSFLKVDWSKEPKQVADAMVNMKISMGMDSGIVQGVEPHCDTGKADYFGDVVDVAARCCASAASGEVRRSLGKEWLSESVDPRRSKL